MTGNESPLVYETFIPRPYTLSLSAIEEFGHRLVFESVGAVDWVAKHRLPRLGQLDIETTAQSMGLPVKYQDITGKGEVKGLGDSEPLQVIINDADYYQDERLVTFGHEVGHIFLDLVTRMQESQYVYSHRIEQFCDMFGREMTLPRDSLRSLENVNEDDVRQLMGIYGIPFQDVLPQLVEAGKLPPKVLLKVRVPVPNVKHSGQVVEHVYCFTCHEQEYAACQKDQRDTLMALDFSDLEVAESLRVCANERSWCYDNEIPSEIRARERSANRDKPVEDESWDREMVNLDMWGEQWNDSF